MQWRGEDTSTCRGSHAGRGSPWSRELAVLRMLACFGHTENGLLEEPTGLQSNLLPQLTVRVFLPCSYYHRGNRCSGATPYPPSPSPQTPCCLHTTRVHLPSLSADQAPIPSLALLSTTLVTGSRQPSQAQPWLLLQSNQLLNNYLYSCFFLSPREAMVWVVALISRALCTPHICGMDTGPPHVVPSATDAQSCLPLEAPGQSSLFGEPL